MTIRKKAWLLGAAGAMLALSAGNNAKAQEASDETIQTAEEVVVQGEIQYRNRVEGAAPVLEYDSDYFQRFEPLTVGDALRRTPSVAFLSDINESDGVRLRGLDPAYTQILINGEQVPGSGADSGAFGNGADGAFFVDRIPAELIDRVEIVRSQSASRSGDALAGAVNIVLRDSFALDGGYVRAGVLHFENDSEWGEVLGVVWGGEALGGRALVGFNMIDRHNAKDKFSQRFDDNPALGGTLDNTEVQTDVRDGTDYSANFSYVVDAGPGELTLEGFLVHTDRYEDEDSIEYDLGVIADPNLLTINDNNVDISQTSYAVNGRYNFPMAGGETRLRLGYAHFETEEAEFENEIEYRRDAVIFPEADRFTRDLIAYEVDDNEFSARLAHEREVGGADFQFGLDYQLKERDIFAGEGRFRNNILAGSVVPDASSTNLPYTGGVLFAEPAISPNPGGDNTIERTRIDPYAQINGRSGDWSWEAGLRYETTDVEIEDRTTSTTTQNDYATWLPSAHLRFDVTENDRLAFSVARTIRNPSFNFLSPALLEAELGDNDFVGNPGLDPETAWGIDAGYERRLGRTGVIGLNFFYRDVSNLIEIFNTGTIGSEDGDGILNNGVDDAFLYSARNTGDGEVWGVEFDVSAPLTVIGMENTGVFLNYSWLDSSVDDEFGSRRFNSQAESVLNVGFIQDLPTWRSSFGVTYSQQGDAYSRVVGEELVTAYGPNLEAFIEHRFTDRFVLRLTGSNLLDESKDEEFEKYVYFASQAAQTIDDEYERETESSGPVFQLIGRFAF
jgi:outer membrane receptor protein involved in Fe transport